MKAMVSMITPLVKPNEPQRLTYFHARSLQRRARVVLKNYRHRLDEDELAIAEGLQDDAYEYLKIHRDHERRFCKLEFDHSRNSLSPKEQLLVKLGDDNGSYCLPSQYILEVFIRNGLAYIFFEFFAANGERREGMTTEPAEQFPSNTLVTQLRLVMLA